MSVKFILVQIVAGKQGMEEVQNCYRNSVGICSCIKGFLRAICFENRSKSATVRVSQQAASCSPFLPLSLPLPLEYDNFTKSVAA